jgi:putative pyruvate formate lyase activating enzyme
VPTYVVSLAGCNWRCAFCLTGGPSQDAAQGRPLNASLLERIEARIAAAASPADARHAIRSVTILGGEPVIHLPGALAIGARVPRHLPLVWKTNATASWEGRRLLRGAVDIVLADLKFGSDACASRLAGVSHPMEVVTANLRWAARSSRLLVRHLLMPGHIDCCLRPALTWLSKELPEVPFSLMTGYLPAHKAQQLPEIGRTNRAVEVERAWEIARASGVRLVPWRIVSGNGTFNAEIRTDEAPREMDPQSVASPGQDEVWIDREGRILVDGASGPLLEALRGLEGEMRLDAIDGQGAGRER